MDAGAAQNPAASNMSQAASLHHQGWRAPRICGSLARIAHRAHQKPGRRIAAIVRRQSHRRFAAGLRRQIELDTRRAVLVGGAAGPAPSQYAITLKIQGVPPLPSSPGGPQLDPPPSPRPEEKTTSRPVLQAMYFQLLPSPPASVPAQLISTPVRTAPQEVEIGWRHADGMTCFTLELPLLPAKDAHGTPAGR